PGIVIKSTSTDDVSIQALSPLLNVGAAGGASSARTPWESRKAVAMSTAVASPARVSVVNFMVSAPFFWDARESQRRGVGFAGADANGAVETEDEDLAVADLAGLGGRGDGFDGLVELVGRDRDLDLDLGQEAHGVLGAAVDFGVALLTPVSLDLGDGHPVHPDRSQSVTDLIKLERLDNGHDDFHGFHSRLGPALRVGRFRRS